MKESKGGQKKRDGWDRTDERWKAVKGQKSTAR